VKNIAFTGQGTRIINTEPQPKELGAGAAVVYHAPRLVCYGDIRTRTMGATGGQFDSGGLLQPLFDAHDTFPGSPLGGPLFLDD